MMEKHDVVIVGAGPAGLKAAEVLAGAGKDVLVLEKNEVVGPKVCAGGISVKCKELGIPKNLLERSHDSFRLVTARQDVIAKYNKNIVYTINRATLGAYMRKRAEDNGAIIRTSSRVTSITKDYVACRGKKIKYDYLIGADGSISAVRKYLNLPADKTGIAMQYIVNQDTDYLELCFDHKRFGSWYAWIFPHKNYFSVGTGAKLGTKNVPELRRNLDSWCKKRGIDLKGAELQVATINCDYKGFKFSNVFLVGDAAGLVFGFSGEGIYSAILSGQIASQSIIDKNYDYQKELSKLLKHKRLQESILPFLEQEHIRPMLFEFIALGLKTHLGRKIFLEFFA
ncbi:MAG: NAD(P)/FAD-dependent oxidoreductase [archaeon]|nr:NAD(P)/FAD-dependent oxidoreductase [archaeon]